MPILFSALLKTTILDIKKTSPKIIEVEELPTQTSHEPLAVGRLIKIKIT